MALPWIALALMAAGTAAQMKGQQAARRAQRDVYDFYADQTKRRAENQDALFQQALEDQTVEEATQELDAAANDRLENYRALRDASEYRLGSPVQSGGGEVVAGDRAARISDALTSAEKRVEAMARLGGYSDRHADRAYEYQWLGDLTRNEALFGQGDQSVFEQSLPLAAEVGQGKRQLGDLLVALGTIAGMGSGLPGMVKGAAGGASMATPGYMATAARYGTNLGSQQTAMLAGQNAGLFRFI